MKRGTLVSLTTLGLALVILACRDLSSPLDAPASANQLLNESGPVTVWPGAMHGWSFYNDQNDTACTDSNVCRMVEGPAGRPLGSGSAFLSTPASSDGKALVLKDYAGTRFDAITELKYSTFRQSEDAGRNLAIALQVNADYDLGDQSVGYQGRLVYEPYQAAPGTVLDTTWQSWDAKAGKWWGTKASVPKGSVLVANPCVQATPCTWAQLLAAFPNVGIHSTYGAVVLKAGSSWPGFRGNVDALSIGINGATTTFDFELTAAVSILPPDSVPRALFDSLGTVMAAVPGIEPGPYRRDIVVVRFEPGTPLAVRAALLDSISGRVVGGEMDPDGQSGIYFVRISGGTFDALVGAVTIMQRQPQVAYASWWGLFEPDNQSYRRPNDGAGWKKSDWKLDPTAPDGGRQNWALEYVRAPMAWGCNNGSPATSVAVVDLSFPIPNNIKANVDVGASSVLTDFDAGDSTRMAGGTSRLDHGTRVASIIAAVGNDDSGMTGMAWRARLILRSTRSVNGAPIPVTMTGDKVYDNLTRQHLIASGRAGAAIIVMSLNEKWNGVQYDSLNPAHLARVTTKRAIVRDAIRTLARSSLHPLFVLSAGNDGQPIDAGGYTAAKRDYRDQVLTVGGLNTDGSVWSPSNTGADVYAPAVKVAQATGTDAIVTLDEGTSFAAPLAAGAAVLLKDFDPSLSSAALIKAIEDGAREELGVKKLDAYGALKKAAERSGAPLCGNRVYGKGDKLMVQRDSSRIEPLGVMGTFPPGNGWINALHGGHRVNVYAWPNQWVFEHTPTGWTRTAVSEFPYTPGENGGAFNGQSSRTHDADTVFYARLSQNTVQIVVSDTVTYAQQQIGTLQLPPLPHWSGDCDFEGYYVSDGRYECRSYGYARGQNGTYGSLSSKVSPIDGSLYFSIGYLTEREVGGPAGWWNCGTVSDIVNGTLRFFDNQCRETRTYDQSLDSLRIYRVVRPSGVPVYLTSLIGAVPTTMSISEDGRELLFLSSRDTTGGRTYSWRTNAPMSSSQTVHPTYATCVIAAIPIVQMAHGPVLGTPKVLAQETASRCQGEGSQFNIPTLAPTRAPTAGGAGLRLTP
jgi:hypothetical protein